MQHFHIDKKWHKILATFVIFEQTAQSKQSPKKRKFAQSGHPARHPDANS
jgi:hypothetical protein